MADAAGRHHPRPVGLFAWRAKKLPDFHFPVGRRYRPSIEDVIEFLIVEGLAPAKDGWQEAMAETREELRLVQLRSVVRRDPEVAAEELRRRGFTVTPPTP